MKKNRFYLYVLLPMTLLFFLFSCQDSSQGEDESIRRLEANSKLLEVNGKITTFPLTIVIADQLAGEGFPQEIQDLCGLSTDACKTLPIGGILRLGPNNYYTYNCIADLKLPTAIEKNEAAITETTNEQVKAYLSTAKLKDYDSLLTPNHEDWNLRDLSLTYINNTADSIFFFSQIPMGPSGLQVGTKRYKVYNDINELKKRINELICTSHPTISVFYNLLSFPTAGPTAPGAKVPEPATPSATYTAKGIVAGDTCIGYTKFEKLHDGKGGFTLGNVKETNSTSCGFVFPKGRAGDTCVSGSKYQKMHDGRGGFSVGALVERNSKACGFVFPTGPAGDTCLSGSKYQKMHDGRGGFSVGALLERNSKACGFVFPTGRAGDTCVSGSKYQKMHDGRGGFRVGRLLERNSSGCGFVAPAPVASKPVATRPTVTYPAKGTPAAGFTCYRGSKYAKVNNGRGGFSRGALVEKNSSDCGVKAPADNQCVRRSEPMCEKDSDGNYTGRRIRNCYNKSGEVINVIVISKCDSDCRCIGE